MNLVHVNVVLNKRPLLADINLNLERRCWAILGTNGSGKSSLARVIAGEIPLTAGQLNNPPASCRWVSLESQQALYEEELYRDESDLTDDVDEGRTVRTLLTEHSQWASEHQSLCETLQLGELLDRGYRRLSSGEARRTLIAQALLDHPELLILDEPFEGLDMASSVQLHAALNRLVERGQWLILVVGQTHDIIERCEDVAILDKGRIVYAGRRDSGLEGAWAQLNTHSSKPPTLPPRDPEFQLPAWPRDKPLIELYEGFVQYGDTFQFRDLNWTLQPGEHTRITGPNGSGKSTLLGLITGDHPQCYRNNLNVLGFQRGSGESIWQIKKHIGYVSGSLHRDYRVSVSALNVIVSGLTDSIGVYTQTGAKESQLAHAWLEIIGLAEQANAPFRSLSMGQQRLLLIARALIKQPPLIILDEPAEGLDDFNRFYVLAIVEQLISAGDSTLLLVSHRSDETLSCISRSLEFLPSESPEVRFNVQSFAEDAGQPPQSATDIEGL